MSITLGGVELSDQMIWVERYARANIAQTERLTLAGGLYISALKLTVGQPITLHAGQDHGWLTRTQVKAVQDLANDPAGVYTLQYGAESFSVAFRHSQPPAVEFRPLVARVADAAGDYFMGTIKLIVV